MKVLLFKYVSPWSPASFLLLYWETVPSTGFSFVPSLASGVFSPLTLVKNVFREPRESFGVIMDLYKTKTKPGHFKKKKKK